MTDLADINVIQFSPKNRNGVQTRYSYKYVFTKTEQNEVLFIIFQDFFQLYNWYMIYL